MFWLITFVVAALVSYVGVWAMRYLARARSILDIPNERSSHKNSVPRGGGVPIVIVTVGGVWLLVLTHPATSSRGLLAYSLGALAIATVSWLDDLYSVSNGIRFSIHILAAFFAIYAFGYLPVRNVLVGSPWLVDSLSILITMLWIVGLTNGYNFMDGIDGIAGLQAVVAGIGWVILGRMTHQPLLMYMGLLLAASAAGFIIHNWSPAKIFMGDVASAFLGYTLAIMPLLSNAQSLPSARGVKEPFAALLFVWPFVFDSTLTFLRRLFRGERVFSAHRSHLYQRLVISGRTHQFVSVLYGMLAAIGTGLALLWMTGLRNSMFGLIVLPLLAIGLLVFVSRQEHASRGRIERRLANLRGFGTAGD